MPQSFSKKYSNAFSSYNAKTFLTFFLTKNSLKKIKQHIINIKNYTAHPNDMVHVPVKFRENAAMHFWVTVQKLNVMDRWTDRWT